MKKCLNKLFLSLFLLVGISAQAGQSLETDKVELKTYKDYLFHIADYEDGTKILSCLEGDEKGWQGIIFNNQFSAESRDVEWEVDYFTHYYPHGKVTSYPHRQTVELD